MWELEDESRAFCEKALALEEQLSALTTMEEQIEFLTENNQFLKSENQRLVEERLFNQLVYCVIHSLDSKCKSKLISFIKG